MTKARVYASPMPLAPEIGSVGQVLARIGGVDPTTGDNCSLALDTASIDVYIRIDGTRVLVGSHVSLKAQTGLFLEYDILVEILMPGVFCHANRLLVDHLQTNPKVRGGLNIFKTTPQGYRGTRRHDMYIQVLHLNLANGGGEPRPRMRAQEVAACEDGTSTKTQRPNWDSEARCRNLLCPVASVGQ